ncbi:MAG: hypothetical protein ACOCSR_02750 [Wenzhouxiangella sp.]
MIKPAVIALSTLLAASALLSPDGVRSAQPGTEPVIEATDVINRLDRVLQVDADTARIWYAGLVHVDDWSGRLERALLEVLGPAEVRNRERGLERLRRLAEEVPDTTSIDAATQLTVVVVTELLAREVESDRERERLEQGLAAERQAHLRTLEKLASLREIDQELDTRERDSDADGSEP